GCSAGEPLVQLGKAAETAEGSEGLISADTLFPECLLRFGRHQFDGSPEQLHRPRLEPVDLACRLWEAGAQLGRSLSVDPRGIVQQLGRLWPQPQGSLGVFNTLALLAELHPGVAPPVEGVAVLGVQPNRLLKIGQGQLVGAATQAGPAARLVIDGVLRVE